MKSCWKASVRMEQNGPNWQDEHATRRNRIERVKKNFESKLKKYEEEMEEGKRERERGSVFGWMQAMRARAQTGATTGRRPKNDTSRARKARGTEETEATGSREHGFFIRGRNWRQLESSGGDSESLQRDQQSALPWERRQKQRTQNKS